MSYISVRAEAERRWPSPNSGLYEGLVSGFVLGAQWEDERAHTKDEHRDNLMRMYVDFHATDPDHDIYEHGYEFADKVLELVKVPFNVVRAG